ncbi:PQQ-binding-like beta-propeller repeat protein [Pleomorphomonas sp. NRK KF1]|uniref:outer membrane protein assembly factor BamB family protein n=1 Tax=Pleomorphomonas sp. NRK KF1 TaxID=2943000 RepID=UPI0020439061|nr:PQQ-binding-like beta-propeller repeat protein [Pleomorphomonas sp. NRK KF1]MCM5552288.1 PQQ-binding-like beta-propeller repeat protein [Pleomorphomonas sp. NRK KF1]
MTALLRLSSVVFALVVTVTLGGCGSDSAMDSLSSLNPFKKDQPVAEGNRTSILAVSDPTRGVTNGRASIGAATALASWSQAGGTATNDPGNVAGALKGVHFWSIKGGKSGFGNGMMGLSTSKGRGISARPVAADGVVYVYDSAGIVSGFKVANSGATWHVGVYPSGSRDPVGGGGLSVSGGRVYVATGYGELLSIDAATSSILWRVKLDAPARSAPAVGGGKVVVTAQSGVVQAFDAATGAAGWRASTEVSGASLAGAGSAAISADTVVVAGSTGQIQAFDLATGSVKWQASITGSGSISAITGLRDASASPVIHGDAVYATGIGGALVALDLKSGDVRWQQPIGSAETPIVSGGSLFLIDLENRMIAIDLKTGKVIWAQTLPLRPSSNRKGSWAGPVMAAGKLWASSNDGRIASVDAATGALGVTTEIGFSGAIAPILSSGKMMVLAGDGTLIAVN